MAILHRAKLTPSKLEILSAHISAQLWFPPTESPVFRIVGAYRFDDPEGEVGVETHLVTVGDGPVIQIPLTYRGAPRQGADESLIATMDHSVLGRRWIHNACDDPVYIRELVRTILTGGTQVEQFVETADGPVFFEPTARVLGSGAAGTPVPPIDSVTSVLDGSNTIIAAGGVEIVVRHLLTESTDVSGHSLSGSWSGAENPVLLALIR
ncbi:MAG: hypothetical protein O3B42_09565 [Actinomycetota bacterium]|nr:hypothetical protein [Actinomycetota bacterium]